MTGTRLYINVDHVATIREARKTDEPDPAAAAAAAERGGADGITVHLREDRRHIQDRDVEAIAACITTVLNLELAQSPDIVALACRLRPFQATLVPERRQEVTTEGGLDLARHGDRLRGTIDQLQEAGIRVSAFIDPDLGAVDAAAALGLPAIELHTGRYALTWPSDERALAQIRDAARHAHAAGLGVHAGHGLTRANVRPVVAIPHVEELNIGHTIVSRAVFLGMEEAVAEMRRLVPPPDGR